METIYQILTDGQNGITLQDWYTTEKEAEAELKECEIMWGENQNFWIEEGTNYIHDKCRGCGSVNAQQMYDAHGIQTGFWCMECYDSDKYPYRKDKYPTIETHGYGERLNDDY